MCDCFHLAFPNWHASPGTAGRRLRGAEPGAEADSTCDEPSQFIEGERPRPQGSSPVEEYPETEKYTDSDKEGEVEHDPLHKGGSRKKGKKSGLGSLFDKRSTPKMSKLKEVHSPESGVIVNTAKDGCSEGLVFSGGGKDGLFIKEVVPESPASKNLSVKEGDQILSATVYFDNVTYDDAIQILEHAQAYKVKLCLKRQPDITESEPVFQPEVIPEEEDFSSQMREQGKTKRHGDARISWPKFPSFGKGRKSHFTRSHSSSEADEQRKLELSPTTSDTESPIKSQDALKGKKRHKVKLSVLRKRGRISSSEDQETDSPTTGPINGVGQTQGASDIHSPECLESPSGERPQVYVTEPGSIQHKVELISLDSTLKTADLTVALADQGSPSGGKKKKKKEKSELKMRIMGKDKSHKQDVKPKSSPKRLQTLGASIEITDPTENEKSAVIPSIVSHMDANTQVTNNESASVISAKPVPTEMEISVPKVDLSLDMSDVGLIRKSPQKGKEKTQKLSMDIKQKTDTKTSPTFKLPKIGFTDIAMEDTIQKIDVNVEECTTKIKHLTTEGTGVKEDPYERLSESSLSKTQLPKREDIEIPGMEDLPSMRTTTKRIKEPKAVLTGHVEEIQAETVQMSIDVDSVKEAVSKLPGYKLPKVDMSGVLIPEEITVIDANAQRISVKTQVTPTKVLDIKTKQEAHFTTFDINASPEISRTSVKLPKIKPVDLSCQEPISETKVEVKVKKDYKFEAKQSDHEVKTELNKQENIKIPGKESRQEATNLQAQSVPQSLTADASLSVDVSLPFEKMKPAGSENQDILLQKDIEMEVPGNEDQTKDVELKDADGSPSRFKLPTFKLPKFGATTPNITADVPDVEKDINIDRAEVKISKKGATMDITEPSIDIEVPSIDVKSKGPEGEGKGSKFKMPNLGISVPKVKGPGIDLSISNKDVDVTLTEAKAEIKVPDFEVKETSAAITVPETPTLEADAKLKKSWFAMPKFSFAKPRVKEPEVEASLSEVDVSLPQVKVEVKRPEVEMKAPEAEVEFDGQGSKFNIPKFGILLPKVKGPEFDLSLTKKNVDNTLPEAEAEVQLPDVEVKEHSSKVEMKAPEIEAHLKDVDGSPSKFKVPTFKLPKFGVGSPHITVEVSDMDKDIKIDEADMKIPKEGATVDIKAPSIDIEGGAIDLKTTGTELEGRESKFKMPNLGLSMPKVKGPQIDLTLSKKDVDVTLPEAKVEVKLPEAPEIDVSLPKADVSVPEGKLEVKKPDMEMKAPELDGQGSKFKMPNLGISLSKAKGPKIDVSSLGKEADVTLPEPKAEIQLANVEVKDPSAKIEIEGPEIKVPGKNIEASPLKFKMPTFKLPRFGAATPHVTAEVPDMDKDIKIDGAEINISQEGPAAPRIGIESPAIDVTTTETDLRGKGRKFKMPNLDISMPKVKGPETDFSLPKTNVDVTLPEAKAEVQLPEVEVKEPLMGEQPGVEFDAKLKKPRFSLPRFSFSKTNVKAPEVDVNLPDVDVSLPEAKVEVKEPEVEIKPLESEIETDGQGSKFKMPKFGISLPKVKGPEIDLSLPKKDVDVTLPEAKAEVRLPDVELKEPSAKVEIKAPEIEVQGKDVEGSPSKFKMPTFKLPKFGAATPSVTAEVPELEREVNIAGPELKIPKEGVAADITAPSLDVKTTGTELEGKGGKFKMPTFGISMPKVKGPEIDLSLSKKDVDVTLPEAKAEVKLPDVDIKEPSGAISIPDTPTIEVDAKLKKPSWSLPSFSFSKTGSKAPDIDVNLEVPEVDVTLPEAKTEVCLPDVEVKESSGAISIEGPPATEFDAKFKKPRFSLPRFSFSKPSIKEPETDVNLPDVDVSLPEGTLEVKQPEVELKPSESQVEFDGQGSKFKMPKFGISLPKVTGPEIDLSLSKKDVDVKLPEAKTGVQLADVKLKEPSAKVEIKAPEIEVQGKDVEGSPSKYKMPTFKLPKFGAATPSVTAEVPELEKEVNIAGPELKIPKEGVAVDITAPSLDVKTTGTELEGKGGKFKMPKFGISLPKVTGPEIDLSLSKKDVDVKLPEAKTEVQLADVKLKEPSAKMEIKAPEIEVQGKDVEGSPSKFKMPTFKLPKFGAATPNVTVEVPELEKEVNIAGPELKIPKEGVAVDITAPSLDVKTTGTELEGKGGKFKMPTFGISMPKVKGPEIDLSLSKKDVDVTVPEAKTGVQLADVKLKEPSAKVEIKAPEIEVQVKDVEGSPSKFKMPTFKFPKFGAATPNVSVEVPEIDKEMKIDGAELKKPKGGVAVDITAPSIGIEGPSLDVKTTGTELEGKGSKFKMPKFGISLPKVAGPEIDLSLSKKDVDVKLPEAKTGVQFADVKLKEPSAKVEIKAPEIEVQGKDVEGSPSKYKMPTFKLPKFGAATPSVTAEVPELEKEVNIAGPELKIPKEGVAVDITAPSLDVKTTGTELEGKGGKFKMPKFGISLPKVTGPEIDLSLSKKDVDVKLPDAKTGVQLADVKLKEPSAKVEIKAPEIEVQGKDVEGSPSKFKMPTFKLPKFGAATPSVTAEVPELEREVNITGPELKIPKEGVAADITAPSLDVKTTGTELEGKGGKFKMPTFGISMPKVKGPEIDLSLSKKDVDVTLPEAKAEVKLPDVDIKEPSGAISIPDAPTIEVDAKLKKPSWSLPRLSFAKTGGKAPDVDVNLEAPEVDVTLAEAKTEVCLPNVEVKEPSGVISMEEPPAAELEAKLKKPRFSLPRFSFSKPSVKEPEINVDLPDVDVSLPEGRVEVKKPEMEIKAPEFEAEHDGQGSKFKMPKFGISLPKVKGPEYDLSSSKKDIDITLPELKAEVQLPNVEVKKSSSKVEIKAPEIEAQLKDVEGSPSKFKMPTFKMPKFGAATLATTVEVPDVDKEIEIDAAEFKIPKEGAAVGITTPSTEIEGPSIDVKTAGDELEGKGIKFKMPNFGISMPKVKGPEIDVSLSKKDIGVTIPETKAEVKLPDVEVKGTSATISAPDTPTIEVDAKLKSPSWSLPRFSFSKPSVKAPDVDVNIAVPEVDVTLPEAKTEVHLPDLPEVKEPSAAISIEEPSPVDIDTKLRKPKFSLPRFSFSKPSVKEPEVNLPVVDVSLPEGKVEVKQPEVEIKAPEIEAELDGQGSKFKMPKFGISLPKVKGPEIDLSLSKKDADITLPEAKAEVQFPDFELQEPSAKFEIKAPESEVQLKDVEGSPSKFKMPTIKFPKFGIGSQNVTAEVPDMDKDIKTQGVDMKIPKDGATIDITTPRFDIEGPSVDVKTTGIEFEGKGKGSTFKMPNLGITMPKVKGPEIDLSLSKKDVDITLPEAKAEVKLPDVEVKEPEVEFKPPETEVHLKDVEGSPSKFKMPTFKLPKFGAATPDVTAEVPELVKDVNIDGAELKIPKGGAAADITTSGIGTEGPTIDVKATGIELEGKGDKFKMPNLGISMPTVKGPEIDLSLSNKDANVTLPEAKATVKVPDVEVREPSASISVPEAPTTEVDAKLKKPRFSLPRFSFSKPSVKEPEVDVSLPKVNDSLPEGMVVVKQPEAEIKAPEIEVQLKDVEGSPSKFKTPTFKLPKFGVASPDATVEVPEVHKDFNMDGSELKIPKEDVAVEIKVPSVDIKADVSNTDYAKQETATLESDAPKTEADLGSPSKFKLPTFKMPRLSFSKPRPEDEYVPVDTEWEHNQLEIEVEPQGLGKSPKQTLTSFGEILKSIDVEFDVPTKEVEEQLTPSKEVQRPDELNTTGSGKKLETKEKDTNIKQEPVKSPERVGWLRFPKFGLSSPSEPAKISEQKEHESEKSPEDVSTTCSVQSSDAFADVSSTVTSEQLGLSLSSPTKVTVKYSDPNAAMGLGEVHSNVITSTTRTERISVEPNLPEKVTILSSEGSSSSADTLKLESRKIHVITSNIQATPEAQHAKLLTDFQVQSAGGLPLNLETSEATYKTQSGKKMVVERHVVRQMSSENSETVVITKKTTHVFGVDSAEPISGETASSIQRLRDSVHTEKMKFFDGAKK
ncbi:neuroblast differentiation-associated protein AHNAK-like [Centroberyx affinis]|uniref:neuroblast differentiation-associated protein AHNAK-like n=1 Tax=Centroberyx affinis TaxID=166261 RepID=UPI003A5C0A42